MDDQTRNIKDKFLGKSSVVSARPKIDTALESETSFIYFGAKSDSIDVQRFNIKLRDGQIISIPYAFLPIIKLDGEGQLSVIAGEISIRIQGRNLKELHEWLSAEKVTWIKESESGVDNETVPIFIKSIKTEGL